MVTEAVTAITGLGPEEHDRRGMSPVRFVLSCALLYATAALVPEQILAPINRLFAYGAANLLEAWGLPTLLQGDILIAGGFHARVIDECTPLFMMILFVSFLAAYPAQLERKMKALALATLFFSCLTVVRIALLVFVGASYPAHFHLVHIYLAQSLMVLAVILAALVWLRWEQGTIDGLPVLRYVSRFLLWSSFLFFAWLPVNKWYIQQIDHLLAALFALFGYQLVIPYGHSAYFQTFNLVTFGGLMFAGSFPADRRGQQYVVAGIAILICGHLLDRFGNTMATAFNSSWGFPFAASITIAGQYLIPFLLWWIIVMQPDHCVKEQVQVA